MKSAVMNSLVLLALLSVGVQGFDLFGKKAKYGADKGGHESCSVVQDDVWEEKCRTLFDNACEEDSVEQCKLVPQKQCKTVHEQECSLVVREKCKHIDVPKCDIVWEKKCVWERECRRVPSSRPCKVSKKKAAGFLPRLWKRSLDKLSHKLSSKKYGKKGYADYAPVPARVTLEAETCEPDSEICDDVEKCKDYPSKSCRLEPKQKCVPLPDKECRAVPREHCQDINVEVCRPVPRTTCRSVPRKECEKQLVKRPRQVCIPPPVITVKAEEAAW